MPRATRRVGFGPIMAALVLVLAGVLVVVAVVRGSGGSRAEGSRPVAASSSATRASGPASGSADAAVGTTTPAPTSSSTSAAAPTEDCPLPDSGFDCDFQRRIESVRHYLTGRPGTVGIVLRDRQTGAVWRNEYADTPVWTASTIKLAMTIDLFRRDRAGDITLSASDRSLIQAMLHSSDDDAADTLWARYSGSDHMSFNNSFPNFGMTSLRPQRGFSNTYPYWGFQKCTPNDLDRLVNYLLTQVPSDTRQYVVGQLQAVAPNQQWGVWGAGSAAQPGNKDGWSEEQGGWVMNSVGFVGPGQRYTLAVMNSLNGQGGYDDGRATDTHVAELLFAHRF